MRWVGFEIEAWSFASDHGECEAERLHREIKKEEGRGLNSLKRSLIRGYPLW